jgi:hypothetical protein
MSECRETSYFRCGKEVEFSLIKSPLYGVGATNRTSCGDSLDRSTLGDYSRSILSRPLQQIYQLAHPVA